MNTHQLDLLSLLRKKLDGIEIRNFQQAEFLCRLIPASCPFERDLKLFHHAFAHIPPLCQFNPFYEQLVGLRFRAQSYLAQQS